MKKPHELPESQKEALSAAIRKAMQMFLESGRAPKQPYVSHALEWLMWSHMQAQRDYELGEKTLTPEMRRLLVEAADLWIERHPGRDIHKSMPQAHSVVEWLLSIARSKPS